MVEDIDIAEKVFVTYVYTLKGIIIRQRPKLVVDNFIEIPREIIENNRDLILCMEVMLTNKQELFTIIVKDI